MKLDLHGFSVHAAWRVFNTRVTDAYYDKKKTIVVITGQGQIMHEFQTWCGQHPYITAWYCEPHNPGSYKITIKKG